MSTVARRGGVVRQFPVGRRRYVPVVDGGCGCRPRRPMRLLSLPSFLKPCQTGCDTAVVRRGGCGGGVEYNSSSSATSTGSSCAATRSSSGYDSSAYSDYYYPTKKELPPLNKATKQAAPTAGKKEQQPVMRKKKKAAAGKKKMAAAEEEEEQGVGVAVEKESSDPRADFRESMVQMVVEMGLCDWDGLRAMLRRLLALNAPSHHAAILTAFAELCSQIIVAAPHHQPSPSPPPAYAYQYGRR